MVIPTMMMEIKRQQELSKVNDKLCQLKKEFCQP